MSLYVSLAFFFFKQKTAYEMRISDCISDLCSSDLLRIHREVLAPPVAVGAKPAHLLGDDRARLLLPVPDRGDEALAAERGARRKEERRVGKECVSKYRSRWSPYH